MKTQAMQCAVPQIAAGVAVGAAAVEGGGPIRVLILTGANNHDWAATTPVLKDLFERCPRFKVAGVVDDPATLDAGTLAGCDVVVSNWSAYPELTGKRWGAAAEQAFADFVKSGKGFVVFHAASATCQDWPEFQQLVALTWKLDQTGHGAYHTFKVAIADREHPITRGMKDFWTTDELWQNMANLSGRPFKVLAQVWSEPDFGGANKYEPVLIPTSLGRGRGVNVVLGHDAHAMQNAGWRTLMLRSAEWAATGEVTIPIPDDWPTTSAHAVITGADLNAALAGVVKYRFGNSRAALYLVEGFVTHAASLTGEAGVARRKDLAAKLADLLKSEAPPEAKGFVCQQLGQIAAQEQVPAIAALLANEKTADMARYALVRIPGPAGAKALRDALATAKGPVQIGVINSLGELKDAEAGPALIRLLGGGDGEVAKASAAALGKIGGAQAASALGEALPNASGEARSVIADALLLCADKLRVAGDRKSACGFYRLLWTPSESVPIRLVALRALAACMDQPDRENTLHEAQADTDRRIQQTAAGLIREYSPTPDSKP